MNASLRHQISLVDQADTNDQAILVMAFFIFMTLFSRLSVGKPADAAGTLQRSQRHERVK